MSVVDQIISALQSAFNWFSSIGASVSDTLGSIGVWIYQGLIWLASIFGQWVGSGLAWIASGISWIGNQLYNFGVWLWNGITWLGEAIINAFKSVFEWIYGIACSVFNTVIQWVGNFVNFFNSWITSIILGFRSKFKQLVMYNITMAGINKAISGFMERPRFGNILSIFAAPVIGAVTAEIIDKIIPVPSTQVLQVFPWISMPAIQIQPVQIQLPSIPAAPERGDWTGYTVGTGITPPEYTGELTVSKLSATGNVVSAEVVGAITSESVSGAGSVVSVYTVEPYTVAELFGAGNTVSAEVYVPVTETAVSGAGSVVSSVTVEEAGYTLQMSGAGNTVETVIEEIEYYNVEIVVEGE